MDKHDVEEGRSRKARSVKGLRDWELAALGKKKPVDVYEFGNKSYGEETQLVSDRPDYPTDAVVELMPRAKVWGKEINDAIASRDPQFQHKAYVEIQRDFWETILPHLREQDDMWAAAKGFKIVRGPGADSIPPRGNIDVVGIMEPEEGEQMQQVGGVEKGQEGGYTEKKTKSHSLNEVQYRQIVWGYKGAKSGISGRGTRNNLEQLGKLIFNFMLKGTRSWREHGSLGVLRAAGEKRDFHLDPEESEYQKMKKRIRESYDQYAIRSVSPVGIVVEDLRTEEKFNLVPIGEDDVEIVTEDDEELGTIHIDGILHRMRTHNVDTYDLDAIKETLIYTEE